jgi:hypothetical protein
MTFEFIVLVLFMHWVFDFVFQTPKMSMQKSSNYGVLCEHAAVYSLWGLLMGLPFNVAIGFVLFLFLTHMFIDGITSRITSKLYKLQEYHWFFVVIGFDQLLHYATIFLFLDVFSR